jgi:hypothetical protein
MVNGRMWHKNKKTSTTHRYVEDRFWISENSNFHHVVMQRN